MARGGKARRKRKAKKQSNMAMLAASVERAAPVAADARERRKKKEPREPRNAPSGDPQANEGEAATDPATALLSAATAYRRGVISGAKSPFPPFPRIPLGLGIGEYFRHSPNFWGNDPT